MLTRGTVFDAAITWIILEFNREKQNALSDNREPLRLPDAYGIHLLI